MRPTNRRVPFDANAAEEDSETLRMGGSSVTDQTACCQRRGVEVMGLKMEGDS